MHIDILIPTYDRLEPLKKCIKSIVDNDYKDISIFVIVDGNKRMIDGLKDEPVEVLFNSERVDYIISMNKAMKHTGDNAVLYASDDLIFLNNCISNAVKAMEEYFPDTDGLVALKQPQKESGSAFGLVGRKFINRFPDSMIFCPDYIHFGGDSELGRVAGYFGRFHQCRKAVVAHSKLEDNTFNLARAVKSHDRQVYKKRRHKNLLWGKTFERVWNGE